ncbi:MAG: hypothetical protein HEQ37_06735 [Acidovorax sp.]|nr:hypothetical protein [Acidovorax sp.]
MALLLVLGAGLWWWTGSSTSLATALVRAARYLPADQQLESRDVSGALRSGGRIGWLRWSSPGMAVEVTDITIGWQLAPLLQRRLELGDVHAARVQITRRDAPPQDPTPPPERLVLPLQLGLAFRVDQIDWAGPPAVQVLGLAGDYRFDGSEHRLNISNVDLAQGRYSASATLQAHAPMALQATVDGTLRTQVPGGGAALQAAAHATLEGTLATAAAQLQVQARIRPEAAAPASAAPASGATRSSARPAAGAPVGKAAAPGAEPMQADLQATLRPWATQPLESATATLRALDLAALWPQAPATLLSRHRAGWPHASGAHLARRYRPCREWKHRARRGLVVTGPPAQRPGRPLGCHPPAPDCPGGRRPPCQRALDGAFSHAHRGQRQRNGAGPAHPRHRRRQRPGRTAEPVARGTAHGAGSRPAVGPHPGRHAGRCGAVQRGHSCCRRPGPSHRCRRSTRRSAAHTSLAGTGHLATRPRASFWRCGHRPGHARRGRNLAAGASADRCPAGPGRGHATAPCAQRKSRHRGNWP